MQTNSMRTAIAFACLALAACKKEPPPVPAPPPLPKTPTVVKTDGTLHAVQCGAVVAEWMGEAQGVTSLRFRLADGKTQDFQPAGSLEVADWTFDIFSSDCARLALAQDHFGPYHVVKLDGLKAYLEGGSPEAIVEKKGEGGAQMVHSDFRWVGNDRVAFVAAGGGGAEAFEASVAAPEKLERTYFAGNAPKGIHRLADGGWELNPP